MRVVNTTGFAKDTKVLADDGRDLGAELQLTKIVIEAGEANRVTLHCFAAKIDVVGDKVDGE